MVRANADFAGGAFEGMDRQMQSMESAFAKSESAFDGLEQKFRGVDSTFDQAFSQFDRQFDSFDRDFDGLTRATGAKLNDCGRNCGLNLPGTCSVQGGRFCFDSSVEATISFCGADGAVVDTFCGNHCNKILPINCCNCLVASDGFAPQMVELKPLVLSGDSAVQGISQSAADSDTKKLLDELKGLKTEVDGLKKPPETKPAPDQTTQLAQFFKELLPTIMAAFASLKEFITGQKAPDPAPVVPEVDKLKKKVEDLDKSVQEKDKQITELKKKVDEGTSPNQEELKKQLEKAQKERDDLQKLRDETQKALDEANKRLSDAKLAPVPTPGTGPTGAGPAGPATGPATGPVAPPAGPTEKPEDRANRLVNDLKAELKNIRSVDLLADGGKVKVKYDSGGGGTLLAEYPVDTSKTLDTEKTALKKHVDAELKKYIKALPSCAAETNSSVTDFGNDGSFDITLKYAGVDGVKTEELKLSNAIDDAKVKEALKKAKEKKVKEIVVASTGMVVSSTDVDNNKVTVGFKDKTKEIAIPPVAGVLTTNVEKARDEMLKGVSNDAIRNWDATKIKLPTVSKVTGKKVEFDYEADKIEVEVDLTKDKVDIVKKIITEVTLKKMETFSISKQDANTILPVFPVGRFEVERDKKVVKVTNKDGKNFHFELANPIDGTKVVSVVGAANAEVTLPIDQSLVSTEGYITLSIFDDSLVPPGLIKALPIRVLPKP